MRLSLRTFAVSLISLLVSGLTLAGPVLAVEIAVIAARSVPAVQMDAGILRDIYLKKIFVDDAGRKIIPVNLPVAHPLRLALSERLFNLSSAELQDYWNQRYFHGVTPPYVLASQDAVVRFVARTPGAIGYVARCQVDAMASDGLPAGVQVLLTLSLETPPGLDAAALCPPPTGAAGSKP